MQNIAEVAPGIYIGDEQSVCAPNINIIFNLTGTDLTRKLQQVCPDKTIDVFDYILPGQELMDTELPKTLSKLDNIAQDLHTMREDLQEVSGGYPNILICCKDGKNKAPLVAGYYLLKYKIASEVITSLEIIYLNPAERREYQQLESQDISIADIPTITRWAALRERRCLTMVSFKRILKLYTSQKK